MFILCSKSISLYKIQTIVLLRLTMVPVIGDIINAGVNLVKSYFPPDLTPKQKIKLEQGMQELQSQMTKSLTNYYENEITQKAQIIKAEIQNESWLTRNWRPITMITFVIIIANNYILYPYLKLFFSQAPILQIPTDMWDLLKLGLGGYVVGRSVEKVAKVYIQRKFDNDK